MKFSVFAFAAVMVLTSAAYAQDSSGQIQSFTLEGGPIISKHFQSGDENFNDHHGLAIAKIETRDYGNWGLYYLNPNSVDDTSIGFGYVTDPYVMPLGPTKLELTGALGLVTGYQDYPVPLVAAQLRWVVYENDTWSAGVSAAALPYYMEDNITGDNEFGVVATTPFLSVRYHF